MWIKIDNYMFRSFDVESLEGNADHIGEYTIVRFRSGNEMKFYVQLERMFQLVSDYGTYKDVKQLEPMRTVKIPSTSK